MDDKLYEIIDYKDNEIFSIRNVKTNEYYQINTRFYDFKYKKWDRIVKFNNFLTGFKDKDTHTYHNNYVIGTTGIFHLKDISLTDNKMEEKEIELIVDNEYYVKYSQQYCFTSDGGLFEDNKIKKCIYVGQITINNNKRNIFYDKLCCEYIMYGIEKIDYIILNDEYISNLETTFIKEVNKLKNNVNKLKKHDKISMLEEQIRKIKELQRNEI